MNLFEKNRSYSSTVAFLTSLCIHALIFLLVAYLIQENPVKTVTADKEPASVKVTLNPPEKTQKKQEITKESPKQKPQTPRTLTTERDNALRAAPPPPSTPIVPNPPSGLERLMPRTNPEYLEKLRKQATNPKDITGDAGDIPIRGTERRRDIPMVVDRFEHKDLSLFQFSQMFHERFGSEWNSKERWVPPESPLRPGDVVYYKIFINPNGTLDRFENLTNKIKPGLNTEHLDKVFEQVLSKTLPMSLPAKLEKNVQVTEIIAIQVVNKTLFMNFGS